MTMPKFDVTSSVKEAGDLALVMAELAIEMAQKLAELEQSYVACGFKKSWRKATRLQWDWESFDRKPVHKPIFRYQWP